jgi:hypothetical protein
MTRKETLINRLKELSIDTETLIYNMLTESTGTHFLDSGGDSGRHWQRNQKKSIEDFRNEEPETIEKDGDYYYRTLSLFHYLNDGLTLDSICQEFNNINEKETGEFSDVFYGVSIEAEKDLSYYYGYRLDDEIYNTYNWESDLSQTIQYNYLELQGDCYVLLQIHNGADVRGGYTKTKLFKCEEPYMINPYTMDHLDQLELEELYKENIPS